MAKTPPFKNYQNLKSKKYSDYLQDDWEHQRDRKQSACQHPHWIKMCSHCNLVLDSDALRNEEPHNEIEL